MAINLVFKRERGMLKRARVTPVPMWVLFAGLAGRVLLTATAVTVVLLAVGWVAFDVALPWSHLPALVVVLVVGSAALCCLGVAATGLIRNEDAAPAITNALVLPLFFVSGVFLPASQLPGGLRVVGELFPVEPLVVVGLLVASRTFRSVPQRDRE